ncbi:hypothetical protein EVAR_47378_1 [Eumeta japonica]|uniref:Uncharacterized protein n=1 Tax=Eumeta variegata TaxID=151549 RepID=A0A4C1WSP0_EUMVA|nr:hypothetical protein EVAR_47378_1 [Eumeta japonica]
MVLKSTRAVGGTPALAPQEHPRLFPSASKLDKSHLSPPNDRSTSKARARAPRPAHRAPRPAPRAPRSPSGWGIGVFAIANCWPAPRQPRVCIPLRGAL